MPEKREERSGNTLFVVLPCGRETVSLRRLQAEVSVASVKARLELAAGLPAHLYALSYGERNLLDADQLVFDENIRNGGVLRVDLPAALREVLAAVTDSQHQRLLQLCLMRTRNTHRTDHDQDHTPTRNHRQQPLHNRGSTDCESEDRGADQSSEEEEEEEEEREDVREDGLLDAAKGSLALLAACWAGNEQVVKVLLSLDSDKCLLPKKTVFGRTACHVTAANDQVKVMAILLTEGASMTSQDLFKKSPLDIAVDNGAYTCERMMRNFHKRHRQSRSFKDQTEKGGRGGKARKLRVCWADLKQCSNLSTDVGQCSRKSVTMVHEKVGVPSDIAESLTLGHTPRVRAPQQTAVRRRVKSAPACDASSSSQSSLERRKKRDKHEGCIKRPPFVAFRSVTQEELRPVAVEYVPLNTFTYDERQAYKGRKNDPDGDDFPSAPCSSVNNSREELREQPETTDNASTHAHQCNLVYEDAENGGNENDRLQRKPNELRGNAFRAKGTSYRAQSAKYYKTKYHIETQEAISAPKARPVTAGSRYREWKTWLVEKHREDYEKRAEDETRGDRRKANIKAFERWLARKNRQAADDSDSEDGGDSEDGFASFSTGRGRRENAAAYQKWMDRKKDALARMDRERLEGKQTTGDESKKLYYGHKSFTSFEFGLDPELMAGKRPDTAQYMRSYQSWQGRKAQFDNWRERKGLAADDHGHVTPAELADMRSALILNGMTYEEWLGQKHRERAAIFRSGHKATK